MTLIKYDELQHNFHLLDGHSDDEKCLLETYYQIYTTDLIFQDHPKLFLKYVPVNGEFSGEEIPPHNMCFIEMTIGELKEKLSRYNISYRKFIGISN